MQLVTAAHGFGNGVILSQGFGLGIRQSVEWNRWEFRLCENKVVEPVHGFENGLKMLSRRDSGWGVVSDIDSKCLSMNNVH